jgi:hypothetical protein
MTANSEIPNVVQAFGYWLEQNGQSREGVEITIQFPDDQAHRAAQIALARWYNSMVLAQGSVSEIIDLNIYGIKLRLTAA